MAGGRYVVIIVVVVTRCHGTCAVYNINECSDWTLLVLIIYNIRPKWQFLIKGLATSRRGKAQIVCNLMLPHVDAVLNKF